MASNAPITDLPIYEDDEDDDGVKAKYLSNLRYTELLYSPIEVNLLLAVDIDNTHPHLFDTELTFVDFAIRKILYLDDFTLWDVEVESHHLSDVVRHPTNEDIFQCEYHGLFSVVRQLHKCSYVSLLLYTFMFMHVSLRMRGLSAVLHAHKSMWFYCSIHITLSHINHISTTYFPTLSSTPSTFTPGVTSR